MKFLILFLFAASVHADVWEPHEKELIALLWKAEHTPEMKLKRKFKFEEAKISRSFADCDGGESHGLMKFTTRRPFSSQ